MVLVDDVELGVLLLAVLERLRPRIARGERDRAPVRGPGERADGFLGRRELHRLAAAEIDQIDLTLVLAIRTERELLPVRRPGRCIARLAAVGELPRRARLRVGQPDLGLVGVLLPVRLANGVGDPLRVRRDDRRAGPPKRDHGIDGRGGGRRRRLRTGRSAGRQRAGEYGCNEAHRHSSSVSQQSVSASGRPVRRPAHECSQSLCGLTNSAELNSTRSVPNGWPRHCGRKPSRMTCP